MADTDFGTTPAWNDEQWLIHLKELDERAWDEVVRYFADELRRDVGASLRKYGLPADLIGDVEQDTWRTAIQKIDTFESDSITKFYHWVRVISFNKIRMLRRGLRRPEQSFDALGEDGPQEKISLDMFLYMHELFAASPERALLLRERVGVLESALQEMLSERDREILLLRVVEGIPPRQLAEDYGVSARTISTILYRAKQVLEKHLAAVELFRREKGDKQV